MRQWSERGVVLLLGMTMLGLFTSCTGRVREPSVWTQTRNNLRQSAIAIHSFHGDFKRLPPAFDANGAVTEPKSMWFHLLPYVEADHAFAMNLTDAEVGAFQSPNDPTAGSGKGEMSFAANLRLFGYETLGPANSDRVGGSLAVPRAPTVIRSGLKLKEIKDGTSNVLMLATRFANCNGAQTRYAAHPANFGGFFGAGTHSKPPSGVGANNDLMYQTMPKRSECNPTAGVFGHSARSSLIVALADSSVMDLTSSMTPLVFGRILCPNDGAIVDPDDWGS
jgi:hypothetical protein